MELIIRKLKAEGTMGLVHLKVRVFSINICINNINFNEIDYITDNFFVSQPGPSVLKQIIGILFMCWAKSLST